MTVQCLRDEANKAIQNGAGYVLIPLTALHDSVAFQFSKKSDLLIPETQMGWGLVARIMGTTSAVGSQQLSFLHVASAIADMGMAAGNVDKAGWVPVPTQTFSNVINGQWLYHEARQIIAAQANTAENRFRIKMNGINMVMPPHFKREVLHNFSMGVWRIEALGRAPQQMAMAQNRDLVIR